MRLPLRVQHLARVPSQPLAPGGHRHRSRLDRFPALVTAGAENQRAVFGVETGFRGFRSFPKL